MLFLEARFEEWVWRCLRFEDISIPMSDPFVPSFGLLLPSAPCPGPPPPPRAEDPGWPPPPPPLMCRVLEVELSMCVAAAALLYTILLVLLNSECPRIVEKNPRKFKIDGGELSSRRTFIEHTKEEVKVRHIFN